MTTVSERQERYYAGIPMVPYDLLKELVVALAVVLVIVVVLGAALSSPDVPSVTIQRWAQDDPIDLVTTAADELAAKSTSAQYGPPYNHGDGSVQSLGPVAPQLWVGVHVPVDAPAQFVLQPLRLASAGNADVAAALHAWDAADATRQGAWLDAYTGALDKAQERNGHVVVAPGDYGPVPTLLDDLLQVARTGGLDGLLLTSSRFYQTDFTRPLLFMGDGGYLSGLAKGQHLVGNQWGMMNETGQYPGQTWLWLYTVWYQLPAFQEGGPFAANADLVVVLLIIALTLLLALVPFIPVLRDIPRWIPVYRLIWRRHYARDAAAATTARTGV